MKSIITILKKLLRYILNNVQYPLWILLSLIYTSAFRSSNMVAFLDVGQGDATLIQYLDTQILVDGGDGLEVLYQLPKYMKPTDRTIEVLLLTHPHDDHIGGILEILKRYEVGEIWLYPVCFDNPNYERLFSYNLNIREVSKGMEFSVGDISLEIVWPKVGVLQNCVSGKYKSWNGNVNNDSVVVLVEYLDREFLLMGDTEMAAEKEISLKSSVDFLKAGHHCSKTSNGETFLQTTKPQFAVCSCSEGNSFGHPYSGTLKNFANSGVQYFLTYRDGSVVVK